MKQNNVQNAVLVLIMNKVFGVHGSVVFTSVFEHPITVQCHLTPQLNTIKHSEETKQKQKLASESKHCVSFSVKSYCFNRFTMAVNQNQKKKKDTQH